MIGSLSMFMVISDGSFTPNRVNHLHLAPELGFKGGTLSKQFTTHSNFALFCTLHACAAERRGKASGWFELQ